MQVTADQVKELREATGAGLMDCKRALADSAGSFEKAVELLRKKGIASAEKRSGREAREGLIGIKIEGKKGVLAEVNCETDFVAKTETFQELLNETLKKVLEAGPKAIETDAFKSYVMEKAAKTGEKCMAKRADLVDAGKGFLTSYLHANRRVGVLVALESGAVSAEAETAGREIAMQVAAMRPAYVGREEVPQDWIAKEKEILMEQSKEALKNKPEAVQQKILEGKLGKRFEEVCLLDQRYIKDDSKTIRQYLEEVSKKTGSPLRVSRFSRYELGGSN